MSKLPDLEGLAIFAKVVEMRSFVGAASELGLSKATVSKAISRVEARLGTRLFNRTSRRFALTDAGKMLAERAAQLLADGEAIENDALAQSATPRGRIRLAVPMSFGVRHVGALLPDFLAMYPEVSVDLHLSDAPVDLVGEGFDAALRIAVMPDSSLVARRLCAIARYVLAAPSYLERHGRPRHPLDLATHQCLGYAYLSTADTWHFTNSAGEHASVRPNGPLRVNNSDALMPALLAGLGVAELPEFIAADALAERRLEIILEDWQIPQAALHFVTPSAGPRPARIDALAEFLARRLSKPSWVTCQEKKAELKLRRARAR
ncbi:LysR family transcriptional regulator [Bradyrhizobium sp. U87765 SZCCT0131]|uniref:LysR family transcriptional regulator n=1 Tax=unclassified Bradyrhizobium TaxID=2631580 RepID=UPI001BACF8D4|nr:MULTISPECIES: LysR family transcriptional regulator [unclassified Bradyrhizobium]MBR1221201.1 LysR family transcriptional regulator [Bradyrhizobium sp. U87765 SZCCT0131]MBR1259978.1 LysR family transcriptional regulator [Bradyrhizobium sp. U87765 SZCCT0134]MBR1307773.1 LysR family transcriptional regulator [Bradyrhizobium sp. U87765 SZCCT0110]MBR1321727.1 LysR family transcriptional regulator [Bradyrhizobium sp. U87765 SZCCT0109]MBR1350039.1 LysR family transcriptional regulator [Bradyrhizo